MLRRYFLVSYALFLLLHFNLNAQVTVDFKTTSDTTGCGSLQASFCADASSTEGNIVKYSWTLGGIKSSLECPGRIFGTPGAYTICLEVTDEKGNKAKKCKEDHIKVFALPQPDFDARSTQGCAPLEVVFEDQSTTTDGKITKWTWGLGGSSSVIIDDGTATEIKTIYTLPDNYSVNLTVEDENGCTNTISKDDFVNIFPDPEIVVSTQDTFSCAAPY
ncbi:MAG TPA: hypothetical protein ENK52_06080, partial [Saprospiraceae bacterium]|nr:hypothetical protein [Saprospiraceae bacterium]